VTAVLLRPVVDRQGIWHGFFQPVSQGWFPCSDSVHHSPQAAVRFGAILGSTVTYTLSKPFVTLKVFLNGLQQREGSGNDFTIAISPPNQAITFTRPLKPYNSLIVEYTTT